MPEPRRASQPGRLMMCALLSSSLVACARWELQEISPARVVSEMKPARIRVTRSDSTRVEIVRPQVVGDSLLSSAPGRRMGIPLSDVAGVSVRKAKPGATLALVLGMGAAAFIVLISAYGPTYE